MPDSHSLFQYCLRIGDSSLILSQRLGEWCAHGPILEEDIAMTNIALDLLGQSRSMLSYAGEVESKGRSEDDLAYLRDGKDFRNFMLVEMPNGDFACTMLRQFLYSSFAYFFFTELKNSKDKTLSALAEKSLKEVTYHLRHSREWVIRLGDGTEESHQRIMNAVEVVWSYTAELFDMTENERQLVKEGVAVDLEKVKPLWEKTVKEVFAEATLNYPDSSKMYMAHGSNEGKHTEYLGYILAEMQFLPRAYPGAKW